jgi:hypothetical protein
MAVHECAHRARVGANLGLAGASVQTLYISSDGQSIAPWSALALSEVDRRLANLARVAKAVAHGC